MVDDTVFLLHFGLYYGQGFPGASMDRTCDVRDLVIATILLMMCP